MEPSPCLLSCQIARTFVLLDHQVNCLLGVVQVELVVLTLLALLTLARASIIIIFGVLLIVRIHIGDLVAPRPTILVLVRVVAVDSAPS